MDTAPPPLHFTWDAAHEIMVPHRRGLACNTYVDEETYRLGVIEERSAKSHSHYFAAVHEAWQNLPEGQAERFPSDEALRKFALIKTGYCDERSIVCASKAEAQRVAAFIRPMDTYALVTVSQCVVRVYTAQSQSLKAMGKKVFQDSKQKVLDYISGLIGVSSDALSTHARAA